MTHQTSPSRPAICQTFARTLQKYVALLFLVVLAGCTLTANSRNAHAGELGIGLAAIKDWSTQQPFIDQVKSGRTWIGHLPGQWGGWGHEELADGGYLDENGWPTSVPGALKSVEMVILTDQPAAATSLSGRYRLLYRGSGRIKIVHSARRIDYQEGEIWFEYTPTGDGLVGIRIESTDPADPIRDISVVHENHIDRFDNGEIFNPLWIEHVNGMDAVRFMDWARTNSTEISAWEDRAQRQDYTYTLRGAPPEIMIALANQLDTDPWFNVPHKATDQYARNFAELIRDTLNPSLTAYVEYSNEVWNFQFRQSQWALQQGRSRWGEDEGAAWVEFYGMRAAQIADIFTDVFRSEAASRLVNVVSVQTGWHGLEESILYAPNWVAENPVVNRPPHESFDAYAITGYFSADLGKEENSPMILRWLAESLAAAETDATTRGLTGAAREDWVLNHRYDQATARAAAELRDGAETGELDDTVTGFLQKDMPYHLEIARRHGLELVAYEAGTHVVGIGPVTNNKELTSFFTHLNYTAEMGELYKMLLRGWYEQGGGLFTAYVDVTKPGKWGSWGTLRHLDDNNPRWDALLEFR